MTCDQWSVLWKEAAGARLSDGAPLPTFRHASANAGSSLWIHGGIASPTAYAARYSRLVGPEASAPVSSEEWAFDTGSRTWTKGSPSPQLSPGPLAEHCACYHNSSRSVYLFGGWNWARASATSSLRSTDRSDLWRAAVSFAPGDGSGSGPVAGWSWAYLGNSPAARTAFPTLRNRWPEARRGHACACGVDRMFVFGGQSTDSANFRTLFSDVWEWVPFLAQTPQLDGGYVTSWQGGWRRLGIQGIGRGAPPSSPGPRFWASAVVLNAPWYYGSRAGQYPGQGKDYWTSTYAFLDLLLIAGGQVDGSNRDITMDSAEAPDTTWVLKCDDAPPRPPADTTAPAVVLPVTWYPVEDPARVLLPGLPMYVAPSRNGSWFPLRFQPTSQSGEEGYLNRWSGGLAVSNGDGLVWVGGSSVLNPSTASGGSIAMTSADSYTLSLMLDVENQVEAVDLIESGGQSVFWPSSGGWRRGQVDTDTTYTPAGQGGDSVARSEPASFTPRFGLSVQTVNATDTFVQIVSGTLTNGGGPAVLLAYGGWVVNADKTAGPTNEVWSLNLKRGGPTSVELTEADFRRVLTPPPGLPASTSIGIFAGVCLAFVVSTLCMLQEWLVINLVILVQNSTCYAAAVGVVDRVHALRHRLRGGEQGGPTFRRRAGLSAGELEEIARMEAEERRRGVTDDTLSKLPVFTFGAQARGGGGEGHVVALAAPPGMTAPPGMDSGGVAVTFNPLHVQAGGSATASASAAPQTPGGGGGFMAYFKRATGLTAGDCVDGEIAGTSCPICLLEYELGTSLRRLPCGHFFHVPCVDQWLRSSSKLCPMCKHSVIRDVILPTEPAGQGLGPGSTPTGFRALFAVRARSANANAARAGGTGAAGLAVPPPQEQASAVRYPPPLPSGP